MTTILYKFANFLCPKQPGNGTSYLLDWESPTVDIGGYDLANLLATFWTSTQRQKDQREWKSLERYYTILWRNGVTDYSWQDLLTDYQTGLIFWLLIPVQDRRDGSSQAY